MSANCQLHKVRQSCLHSLQILTIKSSSTEPKRSLKINCNKQGKMWPKNINSYLKTRASISLQANICNK